MVLLVVVVMEEAEEDDEDIMRVCVCVRGVKKSGVVVAAAVVRRCRNERVVCISMMTMRLLAYLLVAAPVILKIEERFSW